jgi:hypothetical protein
MTDNVIKLVKGSGDPPNEPPEFPAADEILTACMGKFTDVVLIGVREDAAQLISSLPLDEAIFELSRALHRVHCHIDRA